MAKSISSNSYRVSKTFPICPAIDAVTLPFAIDEMEFSAWLEGLVQLNEMEICQQLLNVLGCLNNQYRPDNANIPVLTRVFFLEKIAAVLIRSATVLTLFPTTHDNAINAAFTEDEIQKSEICVWAFLELANAYWLMTKESWFNDANNTDYSIQDRTTVIASGFQAMGRALLHIYQTYTKPHDSFWQRCFAYFEIARSSQLLEDSVNPNVKEIENAFKRILVFSLSNTNQFSPSEMRTIYELLGHYAVYTALLKSVPKRKFNGIPSINLKISSPPTLLEDVSEQEQENPDKIHIATVSVASKILEASNDKRAHHLPTDQLMLLRLAKTLTMNDHRKNPRESADSNHLGIMGFANICEFLREKEIEKQNYLAKQGAFDPSRPGEMRDLNLEIMPLESETELNLTSKGNPFQPAMKAFNVVEFADPADIWKTDSRTEYYETNMRLVDKSKLGYGLLWTDDVLKPRVGSIIGIMHKSLTIGLIRWLAQSKETGMFMGIEQLGTRATTVKVSNPGFPNGGVNAVYLPGLEGNKQHPSLIFVNDQSFKPNEFIFLYKNHRNIRYRVTKRLQLTSLISHVEIVRSH